MANDHPFQTLFETLGRLPIAHAEAVNRRAYDVLHDILSVPVERSGRCILLRAPRAGHGKTHLLSRIQSHLAASHEFIPLHASFGCQIDAASVIDDALRRLLRALPASGGLCVLDLVTRRLFALALQPLVGSGEVPCQDREGALTALRVRPIETFDFHHPNAVTAHWARENFEVLGQRLSLEIAQRCGLPIREISFWVDALFRFAATPVENPARLRALAESVHAGNPGDGVLMERLEALLGMLALLMRVVLVADDLEGFSTDETAALRMAAFLGSLRQSVERLDVILSLNQDIWESAFVPRLSGGLADRLSEVVVELAPLTDDEMVALLESRVPGLGARVLAKIDRNEAGSHARGLIRAAGIAWLRASAMDTQVAALTAPAVIAPTITPPLGIEDPAPMSFAGTIAPPVIEQTFQQPEPEVFAPEPVIEQPVQAPVVQAERAPDPMLAIAFLQQSPIAQDSPDSWPAPDFSPNTEQVIAAPDAAPVSFPDSPFEIATAAPEVFQQAETIFAPQFEAQTFEPQAPAPVEPMEWTPPVESPFQVAVESDSPFQIAPEPASFIPAPEASAYAPVESQPSIYGSPQAASFEPAPQPDAAAEAFQVAEPPAQPAVADTDRVDDLLRQFRERYGRGSL